MRSVKLGVGSLLVGTLVIVEVFAMGGVGMSKCSVWTMGGSSGVYESNWDKWDDWVEGVVSSLFSSSGCGGRVVVRSEGEESSEG